MIVLDPADSSHTLKIIPRYYNVTNTHTLTIVNEDTGVETTPSVSRTLADGFISYGFSATFLEGEELTYKIADNTTTNVVSRGKIFITNQTPQTYSING